MNLAELQVRDALKKAGQQIHYFESTGEAYDACQCDENIREGDVLVIESEKVVGVAHTWPCAVTCESGKLHHLAFGYAAEEVSAAFAIGFAEAQHIASGRGWPLLSFWSKS